MASAQVNSIRWLMALLIAWGSILAIGAMLFGYRTDFRKPVIVAVFVLSFVIGWAALLAYRRHDLARRRAEHDQTPPAPPET